MTRNKRVHFLYLLSLALMILISAECSVQLLDSKPSKAETPKNLGRDTARKLRIEVRDNARDTRIHTRDKARGERIDIRNQN